jgi:hypothetical protein
MGKQVTRATSNLFSSFDSKQVAEFKEVFIKIHKIFFNLS